MSGIVKSCLAAIDDGVAQRFDSAMLRACVAIDATSRTHFSGKKSTKTQFKEFIREYYWLMHMMQGGGIDLGKTRFENVRISNNDKLIDKPDFADIVYHAYRCKLVHEGDFQSGFDMTLSTDNTANWILANDVLVAPSRILWGLVALGVFAKCNSGLKSDTGHSLNWTANSFGMPTFNFPIRESWGQEDKIRELLDLYPVAPLVELKDLKFDPTPTT